MRGVHFERDMLRLERVRFVCDARHLTSRCRRRATMAVADVLLVRHVGKVVHEPGLGVVQVLAVGVVLNEGLELSRGVHLACNTQEQAK